MLRLHALCSETGRGCFESEVTVTTVAAAATAAVLSRSAWVQRRGRPRCAAAAVDVAHNDYCRRSSRVARGAAGAAGRPRRANGHGQRSGLGRSARRRCVIRGEGHTVLSSSCWQVVDFKEVMSGIAEVSPSMAYARHSVALTGMAQGGRAQGWV